jgi:hypothetical protein
MRDSIDRRRFLRLTMGTVVVLPAGRFLIACAGDGGDAALTPAAAPMMDGSQIVYTSTVSGSHSHTFHLDAAMLATPPAAGVSGATDAASHTHTVSLTMADLAAAGAGQTVKITTGDTSGHTHELWLMKVGTTTAGSGGSGGGGGYGNYGY